MTFGIWYAINDDVTVYVNMMTPSTILVSDLEENTRKRCFSEAATYATSSESESESRMPKSPGEHLEKGAV